MAQHKPNWPAAYAIAGAVDILQMVGNMIPFVDIGVIIADEGPVDVAMGFLIGWYAKRIGVLDLTSFAAIGVTFLIEEATGAEAPFWVGDIAILHLKYKAKEAANKASAIAENRTNRTGPPNQNGRREPSLPQPRNQGGRHAPLVVK